MTNPTDPEIAACIEAAQVKCVHPDAKTTIEIARAILAKWGTPAQAAEPVAWLDPWTGTKVTTDYDAYGKHGIPLYTAPQPAPQQEAQEPVATIKSWTNGSYWRNYKIDWHRDDLPEGTKLYTAPQAAPAPLSDDAKDAARYRWLKSQASEELLNPRAARSEICADMRTHWKLPTLICSGPLGGYLDFDAAIDAAIAAQGGK